MMRFHQEEVLASVIFINKKCGNFQINQVASTESLTYLEIAKFLALKRL
jgi:hypothetical protein